jgi:ABC-type Fe3+-siderophore transport system permease subunit
MSSYGSTTNFSLEYVFSVIVVLVVCNLLLKSSPKMNVIVVIIAGLFVGYISLLIMNNLFPKINQISQNIYQYYSFQYMSNFNNMGYFHVWPPILAVLIIFIVLLYNNQLG